MDARYASSILRGFSSTDTGFASSEAGFIDSETSETSDSETDKQSGVTEIEVKEIEVTGDPERKISDPLYLPMQSLKGILAAGNEIYKTIRNKKIFFYLEFWSSPLNGGFLIFKEELGEGSNLTINQYSNIL